MNVLITGKYAPKIKAFNPLMAVIVVWYNRI
jgi:hypothetical protein